MGTIVVAHHELLDIQVAVKLLSPELLKYPQLVERFLREARAAARLKSDHVARVMDVGQLDDGQPYIVMELLEGEDLEQRLHRVGALHISQAVDFALQALEAMAHAHARGIVHRDLKPANLFVMTRPDGQEMIKVLDFGIAKLGDTSDAGAPGDAPPSSKKATARGPRIGKLTADNAMLGSPSYMAPEQVRGGGDVDARADIWAIGVILYEMLTGQTAFVGDRADVIFGAVLRTDPKPVRALRRDVPEPLEGAIARCLRRDRGERFADVGEVAEALAPFASPEHQALAERIDVTLEHVTELTNPGASGKRIAVETPIAAWKPRHSPREQKAVAETRGALSVPPSDPPRKSRVGRVVFGFVIVSLAAGIAWVEVTHPEWNARVGFPSTQPPLPGPSTIASTVGPVVTSANPSASVTPDTSPLHKPTKPFDRVAARVALDALAPTLIDCKIPSGQSGHIRVAFAPDGTVASAETLGPFAGTRRGACVAAHLKEARVRPFEGASPAYVYSFVIPR